MLLTLKAGFLAFCLGFPILAITILTIISSYLKSKPLGKQTTYDQACLDFCFLLKTTIFELNFFIAISLLSGPVSIDFAHVASICHYICLSALFVGFCTLSTLRYLLIFHSTLMEEFDDFTITWASRIIITLVTINDYAIDSYCNVKGGPMYNFMLHRPEQRPIGENEAGLTPGYAFASSAILAALLNIVTLFRIEIHNSKLKSYSVFGWLRVLSKSDNKVHPELLPGNGPGEKKSSDEEHKTVMKNLWTSRIATSIAVAGFGIPVSLPLLLLLQASPGTLKTAIIIELFYTVMGVIIPLIIIFRNGNMRKHAVSFLCCKKTNVDLNLC